MRIMKKCLIVVLILLLTFAFIRITTSTYENIKRRKSAQLMPASCCSIITTLIYKGKSCCFKDVCVRLKQVIIFVPYLIQTMSNIVERSVKTERKRIYKT